CIRKGLRVATPGPAAPTARYRDEPPLPVGHFDLHRIQRGMPNVRRVKKAPAVTYALGVRPDNPSTDEECCCCHAGVDIASGVGAGFRLRVRFVKTSTRLGSIVTTSGAP